MHKSHPTYLPARPAGFPGRVAPPFAAGDGCPAVRFVRVEVLNRWRGGAVADGVVGTVEVQRQGRVVFRVGFLVVGPLLVLGCLGPAEVVGEGRLGEPVVRVGVLNETLSSGRGVSLGRELIDATTIFCSGVSETKIKCQLTSAQHFMKNHQTFAGYSLPSGVLLIFSIISALVRSTLMSAGVAQWVGSSGSVEQISVTLSIMSESPSSLQNEIQTSCMQ